MLEKKNLLSANSYGAFDLKNNEYIVFNKLKTPKPWVNICANPNFGTMITEKGAMFTWHGNSYLFRITPRIDDETTRTGGEHLYLKDDVSGEIWQPMQNSVARHGKGYSAFEAAFGGLKTKTEILVSLESPLKIIRLTIENNSRVPKTISSTYFSQLILGDGSKKTKRNFKINGNLSARQIVVQNPEHEDYGKVKVFIGASGGACSFELSRANFFGRRGTIERPEALCSFQLPSKNVKPNDPCAALSSLVQIGAGKKATILFYMAAAKLPKEKIDNSFFEKELQQIKKYWQKITKKIEIKTPEAELDALFNNQLLYQVLVSRLWGRTGFYQPGGAFGYRDQLQDVVSLCWPRSELAKNHILLAASRQFFGGGVQQWWHPPQNAGVRSSSSDAHLWLVDATLRYIAVTGNIKILKEKIPYLKTDAHEHHVQTYFAPESSQEEFTLFEHCAEALNRTIYLLGRNGLPLILSGDWNDSLSGVGRDKQGESVWLGMFLVKLCNDFAKISARFGEQEKADYFMSFSNKLKERIEEKCWDGEWYLRAFWDSGESLGGKESQEMKIDSLPQSWGVLAGFNRKKTSGAVKMANKHLFDSENRVVRLFTPPFSKTDYNPGYIILYPPGVRENGGAYSHAAIWLAQANAILGNSDVALSIINSVNPLKRVISDNDVKNYQGEPYVLAADIYTEKPTIGLAGWTWYTGSASLLYSVVLENVLGLKKRGSLLQFEPSVTTSWEEYSIKFKYKKAVYAIHFKKSNEKERGKVFLNSVPQKENRIRLQNVKEVFRVEVFY